MKKPKLHPTNCFAALLVVAQSISFSARATQPNEADIADLLTCNLRADARQLVQSLGSNWFQQTSASEDGFELTKPVQSHGICVSQAKVVGAFGVLAVVGQSCDGHFKALNAAFERQFPERPATKLESGYLFMGKSKAGEGVIFTGLATMPPMKPP